ncbi:MAG: hypothetical protein ABJC89_07395 [Acidobacteriota bacterium]
MALGTGARRGVLALLLASGLAAGLWYLRDPPWLAGLTSGIGRWETASDGRRFRWMGGHASLFVPSGAHLAEIPLRTTFDAPGDWPVVISVTLDDGPVDRLTLSDSAWRTAVVRLPPPAGRRVRRIDIRVDRTRADDRGAALGEIRLR